MRYLILLSVVIGFMAFGGPNKNTVTITWDGVYDGYNTPANIVFNVYAVKNINNGFVKGIGIIGTVSTNEYIYTINGNSRLFFAVTASNVVSHFESDFAR